MISKQDPRTFWALLSLAVMLLVFGAVVGIILTLQTPIDSLQAAAALAPTFAGVLGAIYRLQYLHESRTMMVYFAGQIQEIKTVIGAKHG
jgi:hypothetical protein